MAAPTTHADFDRAYSFPLTLWGDIRIPAEIKTLLQRGSPSSVLELGCGVGRYSRYAAQQGLCATGVDFSAVAIANARRRVARDRLRPDFAVGDVTHLDAVTGPFDISFDVGCFHCLDPIQQQRYVSEVHRLLKPGGTHLIWALDAAPSSATLSPATVTEIFAPGFELTNVRKSRRRIAVSHWSVLRKSAFYGPAAATTAQVDRFRNIRTYADVDRKLPRDDEWLPVSHGRELNYLALSGGAGGAFGASSGMAGREFLVRAGPAPRIKKRPLLSKAA